MRGRQWIPLFCLVRVSLAQNPGDIKLWHSKPGMDEAVGVLSIFYQGRWGTVCDLDGFSKESGNVACRQLGYERVAQIGRDALGLETPSSAPIILEWVNCTGTEPSLSKCKAKLVSDPTKTDCSHTTDVQLRCTNDMAEGPCTRVKQSGSYRSPSCLPNGYYAPTQCYPKDKVCHCSHPDGTPVHGTDIFFKNDHDIEKFQCTVDEETGTLKGNHYEGAIRFITPTQDFGKDAGALSIFHNGQWGLVCYDHYSVDLGRIVCQEMGFEKLVSIKPTSNVNDLKLDLYMPVMNRPFECSSKDQKLSECTTSTWSLDTRIYTGYTPPCKMDNTLMVRCGMMSFAEKAAQQSKEHRIQTQLLGEIKDLKTYIDDAVASVERNIRLTAKVPVEIIQKKINRGIEIIVELGDRPSAGLYRMFFNISYPKWLNRIRAVQEGICEESMYYTSCIQCQQRCEASLYVPPRGPDGGCNVDALDCTPGCICPKSNDWLLPNGTCVDSCPMENPVATKLEEESVKDDLISVLDQFKPAKSDGIECPSGMRFSTCKAHCQKRCGQDDPVCDASLCRPGCVCEDETAVLWENGKTCAPECLIMKPTTPAPKLPPQCLDQMETCADVIPLCDNPDINFICPFSCKADHCAEYLTTAPPTTAAYVPVVTMRPTTISTTVDPRTDCEDMHKTCPQLAKHCGIPGYRIAAICMKTCKMCHMKATIDEASSSRGQQSRTTTAKPTTKSLTPTTTPAPPCVDKSNNCIAYRNFCAEESIRDQCNKTCGVCKVNIGLCRQQFDAAKAGVWKPRCDGNGNFLAKQCNDAARVCWCATLKDGKEVLNTRSFMEDPTLMPQMTCTVENGVYVSNFGGQDLYQVNAHELNPDELDPNHEIVSLAGAELTPCQRERTVKLEENPAQYIPDCDENGEYVAKQCYAFLAVHDCWCVDENGIEKEDSRVQFGEMDNPNGDPSTFSCEEVEKFEATGPCKKVADEINQRNSVRASVSQQQSYGFFSWNARRPQLEWVPDCDESGFYSPLQCHKNGFCWCSTSIGNEISGTKQYSADFFGRMTKPNCDIYADGGPCNKLKQKAEFSTIVNCDSEGFFEEIQCTESNCYCVDKNTGVSNNKRVQNNGQGPVCVANRGFFGFFG